MAGKTLELIRTSAKTGGQQAWTSGGERLLLVVIDKDDVGEPIHAFPMADREYAALLVEAARARHYENNDEFLCVLLDDAEPVATVQAANYNLDSMIRMRNEMEAADSTLRKPFGDERRDAIAKQEIWYRLLRLVGDTAYA